MLCPCAGVGCNVKHIGFTYVLSYLAGALAPVFMCTETITTCFSGHN